MHPSYRSMLSVITIIYFAVMAMPVLFGLVVLYLDRSDGLPVDDELNPDLFKYLVYIMTPAGLAAAYFYYQQQLKLANEVRELRPKLSRLQSILLVRTAFLEAPALLAGVATFLTGDLTFLFFILILVGVHVYWRPTIDSIAADLMLSDQEKIQLQDS